MALFVVRHQHDPQHCPATDPYAGATLLNYLSRPNVKQQGVEIHGEAVVQGEHTMFMIVESSDEERVRAFMAPFAAAGTVDIYPASTCARVVASGGCAAPVAVDESTVPALDPEEACQDAVEAGLVVHRAHPLNCETAIPALIGGVVMPNARFYVRNHFQIPALDVANWRLDVFGSVTRPLQLTYRELQTMRSQTMVVTLECAGNGRSLLNPGAPGEQWALGAVSTAEWTGVPLVEVLDRAGVSASAREVLFRGADGGAVEGSSEPVPFERSLKVDDARNGDVLLAYAMNGAPLPLEHGFPLRVIVPGWYAVTSVKWLSEIEVIDEPFTGFFQAARYFYEWTRDGEVVREPVRLQQVRALIIEPRLGEPVPAGDLLVRRRVVGGGADRAWMSASAVVRGRRLVSSASAIATAGSGGNSRSTSNPARQLSAPATDLAGRTQPERAEWNRLGYGNNAIQEVSVVVAQRGAA